MAEPGKETAAAPPPPPQETVPQAPAAMEEPILPMPISDSQDTEIVAGGAAVLDSAQPIAEPAHQPLPPQEVGAPEQTATEADGEPPVATMPQKVAALPPPAETPAQESAAPAAPTPPLPPTQEAAAVAAVGAPEQTTTEADAQPPPPPAETETRAQESAPPAAPTPPPAETTAVAAPTPLAAPAAQQPPLRQEGGAPGQAPSVQEEKDAAPAAAAARPQEGEAKPARRRWRWLQAVVSLLFLRPKGGETEPPAPGQMAPLPVGKPSVDEIVEPSAQQQDGKKPPASGQEEQKPAATKKPSRKFSDGAAKKTPPPPQLQGKHPSAPLEKLRKAGRLVRCIVALAKKKPAETASSGPGPVPEKEEKKTGEEGSEAKPEEKKTAPAVTEKEEKKETTPQHRNWRRVEEHLEDILEEAFAKLVAAEYIKELRGVRQKCLLTFSVFDLASEVKKQAMIYWWVAEFYLPHRSGDPQAPGGARAPAAGGGGGKGAGDAGSSRDDDDDSAEGIFVMLSDHGFLVPMKNWCSKVIHGCQVNPLVHWMLKRQARGDRFAELDDKGSPKDDQQLSSSILCLTAGNRPLMQKMRMKDEAPPQTTKKDEPRLQSLTGRRSSKKVTREPSLQGKSNDVEGQQQPTTKDEAQVGSKSMAAEDKAPSNNKDEDKATQAKDQLAKDQHQPTTNDNAQVESKPMAAADKAPSQKGDDPTQAKDQLTKGQQNIKPSSELDDILPPFEGKRVILNVNAHVYPISRSAFLHLAECLVVLQLGRWNNLDDKTYMEVDGLESRNAIGLLKNLRYLGLRGLSRLTELPKGIENLKKLVILDMRGCQNLVKVEASDSFITQPFHKKTSVITQLKQLTHLDLTECYMLEHIGRGITSLTELQVFKGFVFATGTQRNKACRIQDLQKLKKLQKLTVSITTDANVAEGEMADLKDLTSLQKLTITWSEIPSILEGETIKVVGKRRELVKRWTSFQLPKDLMKLDIRCYPEEKLELESHEKLKKLYLRGGNMTRFSTEKSTSIKTLRLRYLKKFTMEWKEIRSELQNIEYVEIVVTNKDARREKDKSEVIMKDIQDEYNILKHVMKVPDFTLDGHGVWTKDQKEADNKKFLPPNEDAMGNNKASGPSGPTKDSNTN